MSRAEYYGVPPAMSARELSTSHAPVRSSIPSGVGEVDKLELREEAISKSSLLMMEANREQIISLKDEYDRTQTAARALEDQVRFLRSETSQRSDEIERLRAQILRDTEKTGRLESELRIKNMQLEQRREEMEKARRASADELRAERAQTEHLRGELAQADRQHRTLMGDIQGKDAEIAGLRGEISRLSDGLDAKERLNNTMRGELEAARRTIESLQETARTVPVLEARLRESERLCADRGLLQKRLAEVERHQEDTLRDLQRSQDEVGTLHQLRQQDDGKIRVQLQRIGELEAAQAGLESQVIDQGARIRALEEELERSKKTIESQKGTQDMMMRTIEQQRQQAEGLEAELTDATRTVRELTQDLSAARQREATTEAQLKEATETLCAATSAPGASGVGLAGASPIAGIVRNAEVARGRIEELGSELGVARETIQRLMADGDALRDELGRERERRLQGEDRVAQQEEQLEVERGHAQSLERTMDELQDELRQVRAQLQERIQEGARLHEEKAEVQRGLARTTAALADSRDEAEALQRALADAERTGDGLRQELKGARDEVERERQKVAQLSARGKILDEDLMNKEREIRTLRASESDVSQRLARMQQECAQRTDEIEELKRRYDSEVSELDHTRKTLQGVVQQNSQQDAELRRMRQSLKDTEVKLLVEQTRLEREQHTREEGARKRLDILDKRVAVEEDLTQAIAAVSPALTARSPAVTSVLQPALSRVSFADGQSYGRSTTAQQMPKSPADIPPMVNELGLRDLRMYLDSLDESISASQIARGSQSYRRD